MAKNATYEENVERQQSLKAAIIENKAALKAYYSDNKLKKNEELTGKHAKAVDKLERSIERDRESLEKLNTKVKESKPKKERVAKYEYPDGLTNEEFLSDHHGHNVKLLDIPEDGHCTIAVYSCWSCQVTHLSHEYRPH